MYEICDVMSRCSEAHVDVGNDRILCSSQEQSLNEYLMAEEI